jgi:hypothetical protein
VREYSVFDMLHGKAAELHGPSVLTAVERVIEKRASRQTEHPTYSLPKTLSLYHTVKSAVLDIIYIMR